MRLPVVPLRLALALLAGPVLGGALAVALARHYPDADGLNRLYRGVFIGTAFQIVWMAACLLARRPRPQPWKRLVSATHTWAGVVTGALLFLICLTGTLAVLKPELQYWEYAIRQQFAGGVPDTSTAVTTFVVESHRHLYLGFPGRIFVSLFGFALVLLIVTGMIAHPRQRATALRLRLNQRMAVWARDAHLLVGLWLLPGLLLIGVTGIFSGLGALGTVTLAPHAFPGAPQQAMRELMPFYRLAPAGRPAAMLPLDDIVARHLREHPGFHISQTVLRHWGDANGYVTLSGTRRWQLSTPLFEKFHYRGVDGALLRHDGAARRGPWVRAFIAIQPLHFATYAGAASRWLHALVGLAATLLCASGLYLWLRRRFPRLSAPSFNQ